MTTLMRVTVLTVLAFAVHAAQMWWLASTQPAISLSLALPQLNGTDSQAAWFRWFETEKNMLEPGSALLLLAVTLLLFRREIRLGLAQLARRKRMLSLLLFAMAGLGLTGCMRPYDQPEFKTIDTAETGFLIPLEGDGKQQEKFASEEYLNQLKVAAKRVQIPHRWQQTGRLDSTGEWMPIARLVKVERSPVTREWTADVHSGTAAKNQAIWIESADSVAFSMGFTCTAYIAEQQAAQFLYWYPSGSLAQVMDLEVRGRIQQVAAEVAARHPLDGLRSRKQEIMDEVRKDLTAFFELRGVSITSVGMFGGMTYENAEIQKAIDKTFIAQQEKEVNQARFEAQQRDNDRVELEAKAGAEKERVRAQGDADARKLMASAEATAIREINSALAATQNSAMFFQIMQLDVEKARVEKWSGAYPQYYLAPPDKSGLVLGVPPVR